MARQVVKAQVVRTFRLVILEDDVPTAPGGHRVVVNISRIPEHLVRSVAAKVRALVQGLQAVAQVKRQVDEIFGGGAAAGVRKGRG